MARHRREGFPRLLAQVDALQKEVERQREVIQRGAHVAVASGQAIPTPEHASKRGQIFNYICTGAVAIAAAIALYQTRQTQQAQAAEQLSRVHSDAEKAEADRVASEERQRTLRASVNRLLDQAFDDLGGGSAIPSLSEPARDVHVLVRVSRLINEALT